MTWHSSLAATHGKTPPKVAWPQIVYCEILTQIKEGVLVAEDRTQPRLPSIGRSGIDLHSHPLPDQASFRYR